MKKVKIIIPDMQSAHCQTRVNKAVQLISGVQIENLEAGKLTVSVVNDTIKEEVVNTIKRTGYLVSSEVETIREILA